MEGRGSLNKIQAEETTYVGSDLAGQVSVAIVSKGASAISIYKLSLYCVPRKCASLLQNIRRTAVSAQLRIEKDDAVEQEALPRDGTKLKNFEIG